MPYVDTPLRIEPQLSFFQSWTLWQTDVRDLRCCIWHPGPDARPFLTNVAYLVYSIQRRGLYKNAARYGKQYPNTQAFCSRSTMIVRNMSVPPTRMLVVLSVVAKENMISCYGLCVIAWWDGLDLIALSTETARL
jgi:hypothetical protein